MSKSKHLTTFTSIITLLKVRSPELSEELECLRTAVTRWHEAVQQQILQKNRAIMAAKTRGTQKMAIFFNQVDNFFKNLTRNYSDPNFVAFFKTFLKIKQQFQFIDIDFQKLCNKFKDQQIQTDQQIYQHYGIDMQKFIQKFENSKNDLQRAQQKIGELQYQNSKLSDNIQRLQYEIRNGEQKHEAKIKQLKQQIEKARIDPVISPRSPTEKKKNPVYRSNPQINTNDGMNNRRLLVNLLNHAFQDLQIHNSHHQSNLHDEQVIKNNDQQLQRFLFNQAVVIQNFLISAEAYEKAREQ